jgi:hypothetical protein
MGLISGFHGIFSDLVECGTASKSEKSIFEIKSEFTVFFALLLEFQKDNST